MIDAHDTTLIFTNSRYKTERTALRLNELSATLPSPRRGGVAVGAHHGSMSKTVRLDMENKLKKGALDALVATSSLELGIDVGSIDLVCQLESPKSVSKGLQRIGRAGHLLDATSKGRLVAIDRDDLVESAVLVKAMLNGQLETTRIPTDCLDVLAQHIVGAVAADVWNVDALFNLCRRSYCYKDLKREDFERVLDMLQGNYRFNLERAPYPKISWDKVNNRLSPERGTRLIAFRCSGTIPDVENYEVYFEKQKTKVGELDEGFVEQLRKGDIFILGSSSWRVLGIQRGRVMVEDVYGLAPTIPFWWVGDRDSRTYDLGVLVGQFRREMAAHVEHKDGDAIRWLQQEYDVDENGAWSIYEYFREQQSVTKEIPSDKLVMVEHFNDELGQQQIVIHSTFGIRVNNPWAMALCQAIEEKYGIRLPNATVDDGILLTVPKEKRLEPTGLLELVTPENVLPLLENAVRHSPVFASRFRHNAVRSLLVLREYRGKRTPVWLQSLRASALLEACHEDKDFPVITETFRECLNEALDVPNLRKVLSGLASGEIQVKTLWTKIPSPFTHSLLLLGQYGEDAIPMRERRSRLIHLHREVLKQILDQEALSHLLDEGAVENVETRLQYTGAQRKARNATELARLLLELGDLVDVPDDEISLLNRVEHAGRSSGALCPLFMMLSELVSAHRAIFVPIPTAETNRFRWISTENFPLYRAAFSLGVPLDETDQQILQLLSEKGPLPLNKLAACSTAGNVEKRLEKLTNGYWVLRFPVEHAAGLFRVEHAASLFKVEHAAGLFQNERAARSTDAVYVAAQAWIPEQIFNQHLSRAEARRTLIQKFMQSHGPVTKYEIMERYGFASEWVEGALKELHDAGDIAKGEYVPTKAFPQWCDKRNLEEIHRLTLNRLKKEMEPATKEEYADFLIRWQHLHPETQLSGIDGVREVIRQIQGTEDYQAVYEHDVFPSRVKDYDLLMLDRLCQSGEVFWRRFGYQCTRGRIGFGFRQDHDWLVKGPNEVQFQKWDEHPYFGDYAVIRACDTARSFLAENGTCFFDDIVEGTKLDWRLVLRAVWHLVWTGEATNDCFESIRYANFNFALSAWYGLDYTKDPKRVTLDHIVKHMLEVRRMDARLGRWTPTERLVPTCLSPPDPDEKLTQWAHQLLGRYGIVCKNSLKGEVIAPEWKDLRRALVKLELLGKVRRGFFVQGLSGEQYAYPEAVEALREVKRRQKDAMHLESSMASEPMVLLNACDPANPFTRFFPVTNEAGEKITFYRTPGNYMVLQAGQPILLYNDGIRFLVDTSEERAEKALKTLMQLIDRPPKVARYTKLYIGSWNGSQIDLSRAGPLLEKLGFVKVTSRSRGHVYEGYIYDGAS